MSQLSWQRGELREESWGPTLDGGTGGVGALGIGAIVSRVKMSLLVTMASPAPPH